MGLFHRAARKLFKGPYRLYYRLLFGRSFPGSRRLAAWVRAYERVSGRGDVPLSRQAWEEQYRRDGWEFLRRLDESPRYSLIAGYLRHLRPGGSILDVGCGEGLLCDWVRPHGYSRYTGIDLASEAVERAAARTDDRTSFLAADAQDYTPPESYDAIVFNECLYYFDDPLVVFERYRRSIAAPGGVLIVSLFRSPRTAALLRCLERSFPLLEAARVENRRGTWEVAVFAAGAAGAGSGAGGTGTPD